MIMFLMIFFCCVIALACITYFFLNKLKSSKRTKIAIISFICLLFLSPAFALFYIKTSRGFIPIPLNLRHLLHLAISTDDLFDPIVMDEFKFYEKGYTKTFLLKPKYLDIYTIGFTIEKGVLTSKYKFDGKIKAEFYYRDQYLFSSEATSWISAGYSATSYEYLSDVLLMQFEIPLHGKYIDNISVKVTVLNPDESLRECGNSIQLCIRVSPML